jgi:hypothetical protein
LNDCESTGLFEKLIVALGLLVVPQPDQPEVACDVQCSTHGFPQDWSTFQLEAGQPVYTDGSAVHVSMPEIAQGAAAVFQIDSSGKHRVIQAKVPADWHVSAATAEFLAPDLAARALAPAYAAQAHTPPTDIIIDCQAVVQALRNPRDQHDYRAKYAGDLRHAHIQHLNPVKVKAHMPEQQAKDRNEHHLWFGNQRVDRLANEARAQLCTPAKEYVQE